MYKQLIYLPVILFFLDPVWFDEKGTLHSKATRGIPQKIDQQ